MFSIDLRERRRRCRAGSFLATLGVVGLLAVGCRDEKPGAAARDMKPEPPLPTLADARPDAGRTEGAAPSGDADAEAPVPVYGESLPDKALTLELAGERARLGGESFEVTRPQEAARLAERVKGHEVLLVPDADTFLAQVSPLLALLRGSAERVWLRHPDAPVAYPLVLRDEQGFRAWLEEVAPGKLRIIQRSDGLELSTSVGKVPGPDRNGPSVPVRGGRQDIASERRLLGLLKLRFKTSEDLCLVPSFGTEVAQAARVLGGVYSGPGEPLFETLCWVYPTPRAPADAG